MRKLLLLFVFIPFLSCEKLMMPETGSKKPTGIFWDLWHKVDQGYSLFEHRKVNWDSVFVEYAPKFFDSMTERQLFDTCAQMLAILNDPQIVLNAGFTSTHFGSDRQYPLNFNRQLLEKNYWKDYDKTGPLIYKEVVDSIGYIYYGNFNEDVTTAQLDAVINEFRNKAILKGVIIDIRNNPGGKIENVFAVLEKIDIPNQLLNTTTLLYAMAYKNGPKHGQFTQFQDNWLKESEDDKFTGNIIVLTNRANEGNAALFASGARGFANAKVMGDTTGGKTCVVSGFELSNGWTIHFPSSLVRSGDGVDIADGVPPTNALSMDPVDEAQGKDSVLEAAIADLIKSFEDEQ